MHPPSSTLIPSIPNVQIIQPLISYKKPITITFKYQSIQPSHHNSMTMILNNKINQHKKSSHIQNNQVKTHKKIFEVNREGKIKEDVLGRLPILREESVKSFTTTPKKKRKYKIFEQKINYSHHHNNYNNNSQNNYLKNNYSHISIANNNSGNQKNNQNNLTNNNFYQNNNNNKYLGGQLNSFILKESLISGADTIVDRLQDFQSILTLSNPINRKLSHMKMEKNKQITKKNFYHDNGSDKYQSNDVGRNDRYKNQNGKISQFNYDDDAKDRAENRKGVDGGMSIDRLNLNKVSAISYDFGQKRNRIQSEVINVKLASRNKYQISPIKPVKQSVNQIQPIYQNQLLTNNKNKQFKQNCQVMRSMIVVCNQNPKTTEQPYHQQHHQNYPNVYSRSSFQNFKNTSSHYQQHTNIFKNFQSVQLHEKRTIKNTSKNNLSHRYSQLSINRNSVQLSPRIKKYDNNERYLSPIVNRFYDESEVETPRLERDEKKEGYQITDALSSSLRREKELRKEQEKIRNSLFYEEQQKMLLTKSYNPEIKTQPAQHFYPRRAFTRYRESFRVSLLKFVEQKRSKITQKQQTTRMFFTNNKQVFIGFVIVMLGVMVLGLQSIN